MEFIERGELTGKALYEFLGDLLAPYADHALDSVVLGCTHYPFVADTIRRILGREVAVFEGGPGTARETRRRLRQMGMLNPSEKEGVVRFENSLNIPEKIRLCRMLLDSKKNVK